MSEPRKNHLSIDGGQVKEDGHVVDSYIPISETDTEFKPKSTLSKSKEKISDEAEEKLLQKEERPRITNNEMADAKYVVGDHRNGDTKVHIDAEGTKRQFSGLTQEELKKYADDPFWVRLRWFMFILFWALWLCMLGGAIAIIMRAPKCDAPIAKNWVERGPLVDAGISYSELDLSTLAAAKVQAVFINPCEDTYEVLNNDNCLDTFKSFLGKAKEKGIRLIVDLTANFVSTEHVWFGQSVNKTEGYTDYFVWGKSAEFDDQNRPKVPNNWVSTLNTPAWAWNTERNEYYLSQFGDAKADLNFHNSDVVAHFDAVLVKWMKAGASGVRLINARQLVVNKDLKDEQPVNTGPAAVHTDYNSLRHSQTADRPELDELFKHFRHIVQTNGTDDSIFTIYEDGKLEVEWYRLNRDVSSVRPPFAKPIAVGGDIEKVAKAINKSVIGWPFLKLTTESTESEIAAWAMLLPAAPILAPNQLHSEDNDTNASEKFDMLSELRNDPSIQHGHYEIAAVPTEASNKPLLACTRWKSGHTGFLSVFNPWEQQFAANLTSLQSMPNRLSVHYMSKSARALVSNFTKEVETENVIVPPQSTVVLSYVPQTTVEQ